MIWEEPTFKERSLEEWIAGVPLPIGIEQLVPHGKLRDAVKKYLLKGVLIIADEKISDAVVAAVLKGLKDHADEVVCFTTSQVLRGLAQRPKWNSPDVAASSLEIPDLLVIYGTKGMTREEERTLDRALAARGFRPPRVTVLVGDPGAFTHVRDAYGENRTHEFRSKTSKKGAGR